MPLHETLPQSSQPDKLREFADSAMQAVTNEMVAGMAEKAVKAVELADEIIQPETLDLLRVLPEVSKSLERTLMEVKRLEESGVLSSLFQVADLVSSMKNGMTGHMVTEMAEKAIKGVELADTFVQHGALDLATAAVVSFDKALEETSGNPPLSMPQLMKAMLKPETRAGLGIMLSFLQKLPEELNRK